ncbi:DoxX family protein [Acidipropionibacterium timonense]|uniref:DoxX family protein n=1 Tax=Acidipropionibacterium timonense TaxID=2161818 RepID=UPI001031444F|nr:DoxX family protein [Acidipropionibacterium timonense]
MSRAVKRTPDNLQSAGTEDAEETRVIPAATDRGEGDEELTKVYRDEAPGRTGQDRPAEASRHDAPLVDTAAQAYADEQARRQREAERRARERADRDRALGTVAAPTEPDPVVETGPRRTTDGAFASLGLLLFRLVLAAVMGVHGFQHLTQRDVTLKIVTATGLPYQQYLVWVLGVAECLIALALLLGWFTRLAGIGILAIAVLALVFIQWGSFNIFRTVGFKGELEFVLAGCGLMLTCVGSGGWGIDAARRRARAARRAARR